MAGWIVRRTPADGAICSECKAPMVPRGLSYLHPHRAGPTCSQCLVKLNLNQEIEHAH